MPTAEPFKPRSPLDKKKKPANKTDKSKSTKTIDGSKVGITSALIEQNSEQHSQSPTLVLKSSADSVTVTAKPQHKHKNDDNNEEEESDENDENDESDEEENESTPLSVSLIESHSATRNVRSSMRQFGGNNEGENGDLDASGELNGRSSSELMEEKRKRVLQMVRQYHESHPMKGDRDLTVEEREARDAAEVEATIQHDLNVGLDLYSEGELQIGVTANVTANQSSIRNAINNKYFVPLIVCVGLIILGGCAIIVAYFWCRSQQTEEQQLSQPFIQQPSHSSQPPSSTVKPLLPSDSRRSDAPHMIDAATEGDRQLLQSSVTVTGVGVPGGMPLNATAPSNASQNVSVTVGRE